jgi:hypothetical protein
MMPGVPFNIKKWRICWANQWNCWPEGQMVNQKYYLEILTKLWERVRKRRLELWKKSWILHQDNAPAHSTLAVKQFLADWYIPVLDPPPHHSPVLAPVTLTCYPNWKVHWKELIFSLSMRWSKKQPTCWTRYQPMTCSTVWKM